jgi:hypothetical protein
MNGWLQDDRTEVLGEYRGGLWLKAMSEDVTKIIRAVQHLFCAGSFSMPYTSSQLVSVP